MRYIQDNRGFKKDIVEKAAADGQILKIGIIDADLLGHGTRHPNLALLKISNFCKSKGHSVELIHKYEDLYNDQLNVDESKYDLLILSRVFKFTEIPGPILKAMDDHFIYYGGTGFISSDDHIFMEEKMPDLEEEVEHFAPDYTLYLDFIEKVTGGDEKKKKRDWDDYLSFSIGFATRGCIRKCPFCVNRLSTGVAEWSPIKEFVNEDRPKIYLWDDNIMAAPLKVFDKVMSSLKETEKPFQFRQGMDIRLMTNDKAKLLNEVKYYGDYIFAFDHYGKMNREKAYLCAHPEFSKEQIKKIKDERKEVYETIRGLKKWRNHCSKSTKLYVLVAFDSQDEYDIEGTFWRIKLLMRYGCLPYIMRFEEYKNSRFKSLYVQLARWCNQPGFFKKMSFRQFCVRNEEYHQGIQYDHEGQYATELKIPYGVKRKPKHCSCYQTMLDFEEEFPEIAKEYFDLRFEDLNRYNIKP